MLNWLAVGKNYKRVHCFLGDVPIQRIVPAGVYYSEQADTFLWLMVCLLKVAEYLSLLVELWLYPSLTRLIRTYAERLSPAAESWMQKVCQQNFSQILFCPLQHPTSQHSALLHTAPIAMYFYAWASFFTLHIKMTQGITQHLRRRFGLSTVALV